MSERQGPCGYCEVLYFDEKATGRHVEGCANSMFGRPPAEPRGACCEHPKAEHVSAMYGMCHEQLPHCKGCQSDERANVRRDYRHPYRAAEPAKKWPQPGDVLAKAHYDEQTGELTITRVDPPPCPHIRAFIRLYYVDQSNTCRHRPRGHRRGGEVRVRRHADRLDDECPECGSLLDDTQSAIYLCADDEEAMRIIGILHRSIFAKIADKHPRRVYLDGTYTPRPDIVQGKNNGDYWYSASGLRLEGVRITWGTQCPT